MSDLTIPAHLVESGVGLPPVFDFGLHGWVTAEWWREASDHHTEYRRGPADVSDPDAASAMLRRLAAWAGDDGEAQAYWLEDIGGGWLLWRSGRHVARGPQRVALFQSWEPGVGVRLPVFTVPTGQTDPRAALVAIASHVGRDHEVRRALGWTVEPGTLATLEAAGMVTTDGGLRSVWDLDDGERSKCFTCDPDIDPAAALVAIHEEVCR